MSAQATRAVALCVLLTVAVTVPIGAVAADGHAAHNVTIETSTLAADTTEPVEITVSNPTDNDMVSPLVEIPLRNGLNVTAENRSVDGDTTFVDGVSVENTSTLEEPRTAFIDASTFRGATAAVFVEGVVVPANEERTYTVPLTVSGSSEITLEADVRPLNNEAQNVRVSKAIDPVAQGTIDASVANGDAELTISGDGIANRTASGATVTDVPGDQPYDITAALPVAAEPITLSGIQVAEFATETVAFTEPTQSGTLAPVVVAQTASQATVLTGSRIRSTTTGTATTRTTQTVRFDLSAGSGQTVVAVGTQATLPMTAIRSTTGADSAALVASPDGPDVALVEADGAVDDTITVEFDGRFVGDVTADETVDSDDAAAVAGAVANSSAVTDYGDVDGDGEISAVDAMLIQQYAEGNRTADYAAIQGGDE